MGGFFEELSRRSVFRVGAVYAVVGWLVAQIAALAASSFGAPGWVMQMIMVVLGLGFPIALVLAWALEMTPEGMKRTAAPAEGESITHKGGRTLDYVIVGGLALVIVVVVADRLTPGREAEQIASAPQASSSVNNATQMSPDILPAFLVNAKSVAVLPFANHSPNPDDAFFADGVHDDLLMQLTKIGDMHVISRTSVLRYAETDRPVPEIARELGVATVMEGSVQRAGNRVRINVQLIDAETDTHLWAETYDRELTVENIFDIQSEITIAIANALQSVLTSDDAAELAERPTASLAAYGAFIRGNTFLRGGSEGSVNDAIAAYNEAIAIDPEFANAYAAKAQAQLIQYWFFHPGNKQWVSEARASLDRAEALAPESVETLIALGYYHYFGFLNYDRANVFIERALLKAPNNAQVWALKGYVARRAGRFDAAMRAFEKSYQLDPLEVTTTSALTGTYLISGRFNEARTVIDRMLELLPTDERSVSEAASYWYYRGEPERAWAVIAAAEPKPNWIYFEYIRVIFAYFTRDSEKIDFALEMVPEAQRGGDSYPEWYNLWKVAALDVTGRKNESQRLLQEISVRIAASENPYPGGWGGEVPYTPADLPGLMRDLKGVRAAVADFEANAAPDAFGALERYLDIAIAFARAGAPDAAFDYIDKITNVAGPSIYLRVEIVPGFDAIRDHPRYAALTADYEKWAAENGYAD